MKRTEKESNYMGVVALNAMACVFSGLISIIEHEVLLAVLSAILGGVTICGLMMVMKDLHEEVKG